MLNIPVCFIITSFIVVKCETITVFRKGCSPYIVAMITVLLSYMVDNNIIAVPEVIERKLEVIEN